MNYILPAFALLLGLASISKASTHEPSEDVPILASGAAVETPSLFPKITTSLVTDGKRLLSLITSSQAPDRRGLYDKYAELDNSRHLYAPAAVNLDPGLWTKSLLAWFSTPEAKQEIFRQDYLMSIICIAWALDAMATEKGEGFSRGSFTLLDDNHALANYMLKYVSLVTGAQDPADLAYAFTTSNFAYRRDPRLGGSSHHKAHALESQFGIDVRFQAQTGVFKLLPHGHSHILFGKIFYPTREAVPQTQALTFVKFEPVGMGNAACTVAHAFNFGHRGTVEDEARREKDIPASACALYQSMMASEASVAVPAAARASVKTIYQMYLNLVVEKGMDAAKAFKTRVSGEFRLDHADLRTGNEVILLLGA